MARYAVVDNVTKEVKNVVEWDGLSRWSPPQGTYLVQSDIVDRYDTHIPERDSFVKKSTGKEVHKDMPLQEYLSGNG